MEYEEILNDLKVKLLEGLKVAGKAFIDALWEFIREDVILAARKCLKKIEEVINSQEGKDKLDKIVELIMQKIKLPIVLRPFKGLIKKMIKDKIEDVLHDIFGKGLELLA